jgi:hypothetical protein
MRRWFAGAVAVALAVAVVPLRADEASHRRAAEELLRAVDVEKTLQASIEASLELQLKANPGLAQHRKTMHKFLSKYMSYASMKDDLLQLYVTEFSEEELKDLTKFYRTPTGQKFLRKAPTLMKKGGELGLRRVQENVAELRRMIDEASKDGGKD